MEELSDGEIVWVKVSNSWWPGEVMGEERLTEDFLSSLRKKPLAVVKFFQEDTYEYVKNPSFIFKYNCPRKGEFLRKGLEQCRAKKKHMETFPADVMHAERMTGGDPNIVNSTDFLPQKKERYSGLFQDAAKGKGNQKGKPVNLTTPTTPVPVRKPTHAVRILPQTSGGTGNTALNESEGGTSSPFQKRSLSESVSSVVGLPSPIASSAQLYHCYKCNYSANRQNLIVLHMKHCRATGVVGGATPTSSATVTPSPRPKVIPAAEIRQPLDDTTDDEESGQQEVGTTSVGRMKRSLILSKEQKEQPIIAKQTGRTRSGETVARNRVGRTPKQPGSVGQRKNRRTQLVKKDDEEDLLVDDGPSAEISDPTEIHATDQHRVKEEKEEPSGKLEQKPLDEGVGKKAKTDVKLKNELLADWSEDDQEDVPDGGDNGEVGKKVESIVSLETSVPAKNVSESVQQELSSKSKTSRNEREESIKAAAPLAQNHVSKKDTGASEEIGKDDKRNSVEGKEKATEHGSCSSVVVASAGLPFASVAVTTLITAPPVISPCTTIKYRNIPKKQKREYIEVTNDDASSVPSREGSTASSTSSSAGSSEMLGGGGTTVPSATTVPTSSASERPISAKQLILNRATRESSGEGGIEEPVVPKAEETSAVTVSQQEPNNEPTKSPAEEAVSCFDFEEDEEGKQGTKKFSSISPPSRRSGSLLDRKRHESERKMSANNEDVLMEPAKTIDENEVETVAKSTDDEDLRLRQEIDSLLMETNVPKLSDDLNEVVASGPVTSDKIDCNRTLPPKERGKRIFKTRNKTNTTLLPTSSSVAPVDDSGVGDETHPTVDASPSSEESSKMPADEQPEMVSPEPKHIEEFDDSVAMPTSASKDKKKPMAQKEEDSAASTRGRRFENSDFATIKSKRTKYSKKEQQQHEEENQIPSVTSSEAAAADVNEMKEADEKKRKDECTPVVTTTDATSSSSLAKNSGAKGRRGKQKKTIPTLANQPEQPAPAEPKVAVMEEKANVGGNHHDVGVDEKQARKVVMDAVGMSSATKKRKSSEPHLPDSSDGAMDATSPQAVPSERKKGKKRKEASSSDEVASESNASGKTDAPAKTPTESGNDVGEQVTDCSVEKMIVKEEKNVPVAPVSTQPSPAEAAGDIGKVANTKPASITSKSINPRKRHLHSMLQSSEAVSTQQKRNDTKLLINPVDTSTDAVPAVSTEAVVESETPSIPEKRKRELNSEPSVSEPSTTEEPQVQPVVAPAAVEDKFDIDNMPIVIGDNGVLVNEVVMVEQPKSLATDGASSILPNAIAVVKGINGGGGGDNATSSSSTKMVEGLLPKAPTMKEKRPTIVTTVKGGTAGQEQIIITSKGTVLTTSTSSSVSSKMAAKSTVTVTSAFSIVSGGRNSACMTSATTTASTPVAHRRSNNLSEQPESSTSSSSSSSSTSSSSTSSSANGQQATRLPLEDGNLSATTKAVSVAKPSSSSSTALSSSSAAPKKVITKKALHPGDNTSSASSSKQHTTEPISDGASSSVSSSSSSVGSGVSNVGEGGKKILRVSPQKLKEFSRLGYIEDRGNGKVLTPSGMRKFKQELQQQQQQQQQQQHEEAQGKKKAKPTAPAVTKTLPSTNVAVASSSSTSSSTARQSVTEVASSGNVVVAAAADSSVQEGFTGASEELPQEAAHGEPVAGGAVIISNAGEIPVVSPVEPSASGTTTAVLIENAPTSSATEVILGTADQTAEASSSNGNGASAGGSTSGVQESSQLIAVPAENFGGPPNLFYLCSVRDESLVPVNNELLYLDPSNQLVALPEQQQQGQMQPGQVGGASAEDIINQAEVIIPAGSHGAEVVGVGSTVAVAAAVGGSEAGSIVDASAVGDGTQQSFLLNTQDGQQIILDQQSLMALAAGGEAPHLLTADGQQILLQESAQEWLAALSASQQGGQQSTLGTLMTPEGTQIIVAHEHAGLIELQEHPVLLPTDTIQVNPNTTVETNAVLTKPPIMSTVEVPTKNGIEVPSAVGAGRMERKGYSISSTSRVTGAEGSPVAPSVAILGGGGVGATTNLDESLAAVIGHVPSNPHVPTSLELPITVTNPAIAKTTTTSSRLNPPLFPVTTIATTVPSPSDMLSSSAPTVVLIAADQATIAVAGTIDRVPSPSNPSPLPPSSPPPPVNPLSAAKRKKSYDDTELNEGIILTATLEKPRKCSTQLQEPIVADEDVDDIQIPNTPESQQNSERQMEYSFSDNECVDDPEDSNRPERELDHGDFPTPEDPDMENSNSNCSEVIPLQPNVVILGAEDDGIDEEIDNENDTDEDSSAEVQVHNSQRRANNNSSGPPNRNANGSATAGSSDGNITERHPGGSSNNDSGIDASTHTPQGHDGQAGGYATERIARRTIVER